VIAVCTDHLVTDVLMDSTIVVSDNLAVGEVKIVVTLEERFMKNALQNGRAMQPNARRSFSKLTPTQSISMTSKRKPIKGL